MSWEDAASVTLEVLERGFDFSCWKMLFTCLYHLEGVYPFFNLFKKIFDFTMRHVGS